MISQLGEVLLHPVRLRIVGAAISRDVTAADLAESLPDIPHATLYRHVNVLIDAGILAVVSQEQVRGGVRRTLRTNNEQAALGSADVADLTHDELVAGFAAFTGMLMAAFRQFVESGPKDVSGDGVSFRQTRLWLTNQENDRMIADLRSALAPYLDNDAGDGRRSRTLATILIPDPR